MKFRWVDCAGNSLFDVASEATDSEADRKLIDFVAVKRQTLLLNSIMVNCIFPSNPNWI